MHYRTSDMYQITKELNRFDQKYNSVIQIDWNDEIKALDQKRRASFLKYTENCQTGYGQFEYALANGSLEYLDLIGYNVNIGDVKANKWLPSDKKKYLKQPITCEDKENFTLAVKKAAAFYGANAVGVTALDKRWIYSKWYSPAEKKSFPLVFSDEKKEYAHFKEPSLLENKTRIIPATMRYVIVLLVEMDYDALKHSPTGIAFAETINAYAKMSLLTMQMAGFIRNLGYNAIPSLNCTGLNIPLAIDAGLGQMGRHGKLINKQYGSRCRICKVITDIPLVSDEPEDFGVVEFCQVCKRCANNCPASAISKKQRNYDIIDETNNKGYLRWPIDNKKCQTYWGECGTNCSICVTVCSYNRGHKWTLNALKDDASHLDSLIEAVDDKTIDNLHKNYWK